MVYEIGCRIHANHVHRKMGVLNYNTLIRSGDADQLKECKGQVVAVLCGKSGSDNASGAVTIEVKSFEAEVPRSKWTHVAIVASDQQNSNRLTLYLVRYHSLLTNQNN